MNIVGRKRNLRPNYKTIIKAVNGDEGAIEEIVKTYQKYILTYSQKFIEMPDGKKVSVCDEELKADIENKLRQAIQKFKFLN